MKATTFIAVLTFAAAPLFAQEADPASATAKPVLTPEQAKNVLKQLDDLEKNILAQRGTSLGTIIQKLRTAASSDAAALNLVADCEKLVNVERKDGDRQDAKRIDQRKEAEKRPESKKEAEKDGDHNTALRLCLEYLALTLEANESKDITKMIPKLQTFQQTMMSQAKKLHGAAGDMLMRGIGGGGGRRGEAEVSAVVQAYLLDAFLKPEGWPRSPGDIIDAYDKLILKPVREKDKDKLAATWDTGLEHEAAFRKERMPDGEYGVWLQQEYPRLRWMRAQDLTNSGTNPVTGLAEQLKVIKEFPNHPDSPTWVKAMRAMIAPPEGADKTVGAP
jgi:hypothetical protein